MNRTWINILCQIYTLLMLLGVSVVSTPPRFVPTLLLLLLVLATIIRPLSPRLNITLFTAIIFITPVILALPLESRSNLPTAVVQLSATAVILPVLYLLDNYLKQNTMETLLETKKKPGMYVSGTFVALVTLCLVAIFISLVINSRELLYTGGIFLLYLSAIMVNTVRNIHRNPLASRTTSVRIIAGNSGDVAIELTNHASTPIHCQFGSPEEWLEILPLAAVIKEGKVRLNLNYTPPLAGNSRPQVHTIAKDLRGFVQIFQVLEPLEMEIIPRAKYAEWLARRYLQQAGAAGVGTGTIPKETQRTLAGGVEYRESRDYQPGDQMKDIDWKHTLRLNQLIIKDYSPDEDTAAIVAVNLSVADDEEADSLAYNLITTALTLARDSIPSALTAYNNEGVVLATGVNNPDITLRHTLSLIKDINRVESIPRHLDPADVGVIKRNISQLKQVDTEPARQLLAILGFEYQAIEESTRKHPATVALTGTSKQVVGPATILLVSQLNHDAEAIKVTTDKLSRRMFNTIRVASPAGVIPR